MAENREITDLNQRLERLRADLAKPVEPDTALMDLLNQRGAGEAQNRAQIEALKEAVKRLEQESGRRAAETAEMVGNLIEIVQGVADESRRVREAALTAVGASTADGGAPALSVQEIATAMMADPVAMEKLRDAVLVAAGETPPQATGGQPLRDIEGYIDERIDAALKNKAPAVAETGSGRTSAMADRESRG